MATGGIPLARVWSVLLIAVLLVGSAFVSPAAAQESAAAAKLQEGLTLLRAGDRESVEKAISVLREALAADLSSEDALAALAQAEYAGWQSLLNLMASGAEGANVAIAILDIATPRLPEKAFSEEELQGLVKTAVESEGFSDRFDAATTLARVYGEFAVPYLLQYLDSSNTDQKINAHITLMNRIGRPAVPPLAAALLKAGASARLMIATELGTIGDERALAAVTEATGDADANVREAAVKARQKLVEKFSWAADLGAAELYLRLAQLYYAGNYRVMAYTDRPLVTWSWTDRLAYQPVPRHLYLLKLAENACYDALRLDASSLEARSLLARVLASEKSASDAVAPQSEGDELTDAYAAGLVNAEGAVAAMGWETLSHALGASLDQNDKIAATFLLNVMPVVYGGADFTAENPVVRATMDSSAGVRIAAIEAVLRFNETRRITAFPDPDGFMSLVAEAAGEIIPRNVLVVDTIDVRRNKVITELNRAKLIVYDARTGSEGFILARRLAGLDLVIVSSDIGDMDTVALLRRLGEDDRTKNTPVMIVAHPDRAADAQWRGLFEGKVAGIAGILEGPGLPGEEFVAAVKGAFQGESPGAIDRYARSAEVLDALATTDTGNALFHWQALTGTVGALLAADVPDEPPVRLNAIRALANIGDPAGLPALVACFGSASNPAMKAAAGAAMAGIYQRNPQGLDDAAFGALLKGTRSSDAMVRMAAYAALGAAQLSVEQAVACAVGGRPTVGSPATEEGAAEEAPAEEGGGEEEMGGEEETGEEAGE